MAIEADVTDPDTLEAVTVNENCPGVVGVPDSTPVDDCKDSPVGKEPDPTLNVGAGDPDALNVYEYAVPTTPVDAGVSAVKTGTEPTVTVSDPEVTDPKTFDALIVNVEGPVVVGVPDNTPLDVFSDNPAGNDPDATENDAAGYPDAANVYEYALPTTPVDAGDTAVNAGTEPTVIEIDADVTDPDEFVADTENV